MSQEEGKSGLDRINSRISRATNGEIWDIREPLKVIAQGFLAVAGGATAIAIPIWLSLPEEIKRQIISTFSN